MSDYVAAPLAADAIPAHAEYSRATLIGFTAILMWGFMPPLAAFLGPVPAFQINAIAFTIAFTAFLLKWVKGNEPVTWHFQLPWRAWALGIFGIFGFHFFYFLAYKNAPAISCLIIVNLWPLLTVLFSGLILGYALHWWHFLAGGLGLAGVIAITQGMPPSADPGANPLLGYAQALACAFIWALYSVGCRKFSADLKRESVGVFCGVTAALSWLCHFLFEDFLALSTTQWLILLISGLGPVGLAFLTWDYGMRHGNVRTLGVLSYTGPLIGATGLLLLGFTPFSWVLLLAGALIVCAAVLGSLERFPPLRR